MSKEIDIDNEEQILKECEILKFFRICYEECARYGRQKISEKSLKPAIDELYEYQQKDNKIADLEAKLAEREFRYENLHNLYYKDTEQLKQQLADKEKENVKLKGVVDSFDKLKQYHKDAKQLIFLNPDNVYVDGHKLVIEKANQDKISFAVDILEELADCSNYINSKLDFECGSYVSEKAIRDKIKYLKGKKDE